MKKPLGILFDIGDTIVLHEEFNPILGYTKLLELAENPQNITAEEIQMRASQLIQVTFEKRDIFNHEINFKSFLRLLFEYYDIKFKVPLSEVEKIYNQYAYKNKPIDGSQELFDLLNVYKIKYGALSNSTFTKETIEDELERNGLRPNFEFIISSCDYGIRKPNPIIFELGLRKLGMNAEDIWFIGDQIRYDMEGAKKVGMFPVWLNKNHQISEPKLNYFEVNRIEEIVNLIKHLYQQ